MVLDCFSVRFPSSAAEPSTTVSASSPRRSRILGLYVRMQIINRVPNRMPKGLQRDRSSDPTMIEHQRLEGRTRQEFHWTVATCEYDEKWKLTECEDAGAVGKVA